MSCLHPRPRWSWPALVAALLPIVGCGGTDVTDGPASHTTGPSITKPNHADETTPRHPPVEPLPLTIAELAATAEPIAEYDGKLVDVTGLVIRPGRVDPVSESMIVLVGKDGFGPSVPFALTVHAHFPLPAKTKLRELAPTQQVTLRGELRNVSAKIWELHNSDFAATKPPTAVGMTAVDLTQSFVDGDGESLLQRYDGRLLKVTGTVARNPMVVDRLLAVLLAGANRDGESTFVAVLIEPEHFGAAGEPLPDANDLATRDLFPVGSKVSFQGHVLVFEIAELTPGGPPAIALLGYPNAWPESLGPRIESNSRTE